uniref:SERTA motif n=1 Tax=Siphoviridae sp. cttm829 TaxID=2825707 RepID=A0A8S5PGS1_9CAUD|nr:MAG TPA: SERTA motif [Siphoviridae sp. cttm829]
MSPNVPSLHRNDIINNTTRRKTTKQPYRNNSIQPTYN